jgi:hypothetical protein
MLQKNLESYFLRGLWNVRFKIEIIRPDDTFSQHFFEHLLYKTRRL